ncbi:P-loop containing nucleoside triphosphate hydrolase protein [Trichoderma ceciliae]
MRAEDGLDGLYIRIAIRRLAQGRGSRGFGNARVVENLLACISQRQAQRLMKEKQEKPDCEPNYFKFTKEDIIGLKPSKVVKNCEAWEKLQKLVGLGYVKNCVQRLIGMLGLNYEREMQEKYPLRFSLNQLFIGEPGTAKTTVAKLYGRILADLGYLSRGDVVLKNPADFIGECLGKSEAKTRKILEATVGKVLVIDEAYMLDAGDPSKKQDKFKTGVIDTIVAMIQGVPGEDRCIILVGYEDKICNMFHNVNPGLSRRFPIERPFRFENFTLRQMREILELKISDDDLEATDEALLTAESMFEKALMRPKFSNAGEVDKILATAKLNYEMRLSALPLEQEGRTHIQDDEFKLHAVDFDPDVRLGADEKLDCREILNGMVQESIINKLVGYQQSCIGAREGKFNPRNHVPTNFIFKGPSGTGKTMTAKHMGTIFYNMGFLSDREVIECSATDLIRQYVGQTAPKTKRKLEEGMGRVLFIDEAYRLTSSTFAQEAMDEIIQFLTKPTNAGKCDKPGTYGLV